MNRSESQGFGSLSGKESLLTFRDKILSQLQWICQRKYIQATEEEIRNFLPEIRIAKPGNMKQFVSCMSHFQNQQQ